MEILVSILITVYNKAKFLEDAIKSALSSTFENFEIIIVDDCSLDNSYSIAKLYAQKDGRIKVFKNEINLGDYPNRNRAASYASGKYIKYLDADDLIYPHSLEIMVKSMEQFQESALGISQEVLEDYKPYPFLLTPHEAYMRQFLQRGVLDPGPTSVIIKRSIFEELGGFSGTRYIGDSEFWLKVAAKYPILKIQSGLVFWRRHEGQEYKLGNLKNDYTILDFKVKLNALNDYNCPLNFNERKIAKQKINYRHGRILINLTLKKFKFTRTIQIMVETKFSIFNFLKTLFPWRFYQKIAKF